MVYMTHSKDDLGRRHTLKSIKLLHSYNCKRQKTLLLTAAMQDVLCIIALLALQKWVTLYLVESSQYWMTYRRVGFLAVIRFCYSYSLYPPPLSVSTTGDTQEDWERETTCWRERGWWGRSQIIRQGETAWSSTNYSILSGRNHCRLQTDINC